ncbi:hypothetical protein KKI23_01340 [Patescibacteria group bacterium]|nr:hypothetical protein [Patescibacteria group bacterium]
MNSQNLQEKMPEVYREFFSKSEIVTSSSGNFYWVGDHAVTYGGLRIVQKLPLKAFVGLESLSENIIEFGDWLFIIPSKSIFENKDIGQIVKNKLAAVIKKEILKLIPSDQFSGFKIHALVEVPTECGLHSSGAISASLALAIFIKYGLATEKEINNWKNINSRQLIKDPQYKFDPIFRLAWKIESVFHADASSGHGPFVSLINSTYPIIYFTEKRSGDYDNHPWTRMPSNLMGHYELLDDMQYWGYRMSDVYNLKKMDFSPIEFGLIYSGLRNNTSAIIRSMNDLQSGLNAIASELKEFFKKNTEITKAKPLLYKLVGKQGGYGYWERRVETLSIIGSRTLVCFKELYEKGSTDRVLNNLFDSLNQYHEILHLFEASKPFLDKMCNELRAFGQQYYGQTIGAKLTGAGRGGDVIFAAPYGTFHDSIRKLMINLKRECGEDIWLDYASWEDGMGNEGGIIEQDLSNKVYSDFVSAGSVFLKIWENHFKPKIEVVSLEEYDGVKEDVDLLIDKTSNKVCVRGECLTSKEIHSAKVTVEILDILLKNINKQVPASQLPPSSYIDRNEMQSKIVSPLVNIIKKKINKTLPLVIRGGLRKNFYMKIDPDDMTIALIDKKF